MSVNPIERLRAMVDAERIHRPALLHLESLGDVRQIADALMELGGAIDAAQLFIEEWQDAERGEKADARDRALESIESVCNIVEYDIGECDVPEWLYPYLDSERTRRATGDDDG